MESGFKIFLNILIYAFVISLLRRSLYFKRLRKNEVLVGGGAILILCLFPFWSGDYSHYAEDYTNLLKGITTNIEPVYIFVAQHLSFSYLSFRIVLWGCSFLIVCYLYKRLNLKMGLTLFIFASTSVVTFAYARASIAMTLLFIGFSLIVLPVKKLALSYVIGVILMLSSYYFHQSAAYGIAMCLATLLMYNINKKKIAFLFVLVICCFFYLRGRIDEFMLISSNGDEALRVVDRAQYYGNADSSKSGIAAIIETVFARSVFYIVVFIYLKAVVKGAYKNFPISIKIFSTASFLIISIANLFLLDWGINTYAFYYRLMNYAIIPMVVLLTYCYATGVYPKLVRITCGLGVASSFYTLFYALYIAFT